MYSISLSELYTDIIGDTDLNTNYIDIQLLRVITPGANIGTSTAYMCNNKNRVYTICTILDYCYRHLFLVKTHRLCYLLEARNINICALDRNIELHDNGVLTMDAIIRIIALLPIITYMAGNIPMLETPFPAILMRHPCQMQIVNIDNEIKANDSQFMLHNEVHFNLNRTALEESSCSRLFCAKQIFRDQMGQRGCAFYHMNQRKPNLALDHTIRFVFNNT